MINNFLFFSLDLCHAFKLVNRRTYFNFRCRLFLLCSQYFSSAYPNLLKRSFSCSCRCIFVNKCLFLCNVLYIIVCHFLRFLLTIVWSCLSIYKFLLPLCYIQTCLPCITESIITVP